MRIMGIDPGTRCVGYAVIEKNGSQLSIVDSGTVRPAAGRELPVRLREIFDGLMEHMKKHTPDSVAIEDVFAGKGARSSIKIGEARGVAMLCAALNDAAVTGYTATNVKLAVTGNGHASKEQVQKMVKTLLGLGDRKLIEDEADALAIAICHCHRS